jgi:hypothetical protein
MSLLRSKIELFMTKISLSNYAVDVLMRGRAALKYLLTLQPHWNDLFPELCFEFYL